MNKKQFLTTAFVSVLLFSAMVGLQFVRLAEANPLPPLPDLPHIYIRSDGSVEGTGKIQRDGNFYTFTDNIYDSIVVEREKYAN